MTQGTFERSGDRLVGRSDRIEVEFDAASGALRALACPVTGQRLLGPGQARLPAWRLVPQGTTTGLRVPWLVGLGFDQQVLGPDGADVTARVTTEGAQLRWDLADPHLAVVVDLAFGSTGDLELWPRVEVGPGVSPPAHLEFPILEPEDLGTDGLVDHLAFPAHSGWLVRRPREQPPLVAPYPDGYLGCSLQFLAYYATGRGGLYLATHDPHVTHKELRFAADAVSIRHDAWDLRAGTDVDLDYPVVLGALTVGDWHEAVDRYRAWALTAPWARHGSNVDRAGTSRPRWLFEEVGLSIWGTPSSLDWSARYRWFRDILDGPAHVVAGWDWPGSRPHAVGTEGWFPATFHPANLEAWRDHRVTPYLNDLFVSSQADDFLERWEPALVFPYTTFPFTGFSEPVVGWVDGAGATPDPRVVTDVNFFVCPSTPEQRDLHAWRDQRLVGDHDLDGVFYDISSGNPFAARCLRASHGHTPGWSRELLRAYAENNDRSDAAMAEALGRPAAQGVETIVEHVIGSVDFYVSRAAGGPMALLEGLTLGPEEDLGGGRELIPLFQAVYHDVGPVHEDGWLTLARAEGDIFYWVAARIALQWGGILSLHYANNPPEALPVADRAEVVSWDGAHHRFEELPALDTGKVAFLAELVAARTRFARAHLAYGRLVRPAAVESPPLELSFHREVAVYSAIHRTGTWLAPQVVHGAWQAHDGTVGLAFCNLAAEQPIDLEVPLDPARAWGLPGPTVTAARVDRDGSRLLHRGLDVATPTSLVVDLPPRRIVLVTLGAEPAPASAAG